MSYCPDPDNIRRCLAYRAGGFSTALRPIAMDSSLVNVWINLCVKGWCHLVEVFAALLGAALLLLQNRKTLANSYKMWYNRFDNCVILLIIVHF